MNRVRALIDLKRWDEARAELTSIIGSEPGNGQLWLELSHLELQAGDAVRALEAIDRAIGLGLVTLRSLRHKAFVLWAANRNAEALQTAQEALALGPDDASLHTMLARLLARRRDGRPEAEAHARRAIELAPESASAHLSLAVAFLGAGGKASARRAREPIAVASGLAPDDPDVLCTMATIDLRLGRPGRAVRQFSLVLRNSPQHATALYNLPIAVWAYLMRTRFVTLSLGLAALVCAACGAGAETFGTGAAVVTHVVATGVVAALAWLLLVHRTVRIFPPGMRTAAVTLLRRDRLSRPIVLGTLWAVCWWLVLAAVPWSSAGAQLAFLVLVTGNLGYTAFLAAARRRLSALNRHADEVRRSAWAEAATRETQGDALGG